MFKNLSAFQSPAATAKSITRRQIWICGAPMVASLLPRSPSSPQVYERRSVIIPEADGNTTTAFRPFRRSAH